jgi:hypothetical protein
LCEIEEREAEPIATATAVEARVGAYKMMLEETESVVYL